MYHNLRAEMARADVKVSDLAEALDITEKTASKKMRGETSFTIDECQIIRDTFFENCTLDYLFEKAEKVG